MPTLAFRSIYILIQMFVILLIYRTFHSLSLVCIMCVSRTEVLHTRDEYRQARYCTHVMSTDKLGTHTR